MILKKIIRDKREELEIVKSKTPLSDLRARARDLGSCRPFSGALQREKGGSTRIIAEVKKASPSRGIIREDFDPVAIANVYEEYGASAISCLTEKNHFLGDLRFLPAIKEAVSIPLLRKDFIVDHYQVIESRVAGADAFLLIAALLEKTQLREYVHMGRELGMESLVEVHSEGELERALDSDSPLIGINNRDLTTFRTDLTITGRLIRMIPDGVVIVSESGIHHRQDITILEGQGVDAFLIGEALMREKDIGKKLRELLEK